MQIIKKAPAAAPKLATDVLLAAIVIVVAIVVFQLLVTKEEHSVSVETGLDFQEQATALSLVRRDGATNKPEEHAFHVSLDVSAVVEEQALAQRALYFSTLDGALLRDQTAELEEATIAKIFETESSAAVHVDEYARNFENLIFMLGSQSESTRPLLLY